MKPINGCKQDEVWDHWKKVEKVPENDTEWRGDIRNPLPTSLMWFLAEIEEKDIAKIYIISSDDWRGLTQTFKLLDVVDTLDRIGNNDKIGRKILEKRKIFKNNIDGLDRKLIFVSPTVEGNFTIIEGNQRAVALQSLGKLVGTQIYLGISSKIENYCWARYARK